jgi:hypothetical protein
MLRSLCTYCLILVLLLTGCADSQTGTAPPTASSLKPVTLDNTVKIAAGQTIYVPAYSAIYMWEQRRSMDLTTTLSIRNTDLKAPIIIAAVTYYNDTGQLIRQYLEQPVELNPMASTSFVVNQEDRTGGIGASFLVEWVAQQTVTAPVVQAIMINTSGNQGLSFVSEGRVIKSR